MTEPDLRHRCRQLEQHRQHPGRRETEIEPRDEQREKWREDVAVAVHHHVRTCHEDDGRVQPGRGKIHADRRPNRASTREEASVNS